MNLLKGGVLSNITKYAKHYLFRDKAKDRLISCVFPSPVPEYLLEYPYDLAIQLGLENVGTNELLFTDDLFESPEITLYEDQEEVINNFKTKPYGILVSNPGTGKTVMCLYLIKYLKLKTLILVNSAYLLRQWEEAFIEFYNYQPGVLGDKSKSIKDITVATFQTFNKIKEDYPNTWSFIVVDECHHTPANTFSGVLRSLEAPFKFGVTGTLERKDGLENLTKYYLGNRVIINEVDNTLTPEIIIVKTDIHLGGDSYVECLTDLAENSLLHDKVYEMTQKAKDRHQLIICFRVLTVERLLEILPEAISITGSSTKEERENLNERVLENKIIISTTLQEGVNIVNLDTLHLIHPNNNLPQLTQRIARINRVKKGKKVPLVFDYWFKQGTASGFSVANQQKERYYWYQKKGYKIHVI